MKLVMKSPLKIFIKVNRLCWKTSSKINQPTTVSQIDTNHTVNESQDLCHIKPLDAAWPQGPYISNMECLG